ncbi:MAG: nuclear transport factor 2 family protein [Gammaproteobacteria bacterium]|jgi:hypothetical protein
MVAPRAGAIAPAFFVPLRSLAYTPAMGRTYFQSSALCLTVLVGLLSACSKPPPAETAIRQVVTTTEAAVEQRNIEHVADVLADDFTAAGDRDRKASLRLLQVYFMGHQDIHLFTRIVRVELAGDSRARAEVLVAMSGEPVHAAGELKHTRASIYRFHIGLTRDDGEWKILSARWEPAALGDFLGRR